ncbi:MAG: hypothetical protein ACOCW5_05055 [Spirochaetia bacterium]
MGKKANSLNRDQQQSILEQQSPEQKLDSLEKESRNMLELNPEYGRQYILNSYKRKHRNDPQRTS